MTKSPRVATLIISPIYEFQKEKQKVTHAQWINLHNSFNNNLYEGVSNAISSISEIFLILKGKDYLA